MKELFAWKAKEFEDFEKNNDWYWTVGLIGLVGAGIAFWQDSFSFAVLILVCAFTLIVFANTKHGVHSILITDDYVMVDEKQILWKDIIGFSIIDTKDELGGKKVIFETTNSVRTKISFKIDRNLVNPETLRSFLKEKTQEKELQESISKSISEKIKF